MKTTRQLASVLSLGFISFYLCWIIFVGTFSLHELLIGVLGALLATAGLSIINRHYPARFHPRLRDLRSLWRLPGYLISDTWKILALRAKDLRSIRTANSLFRVVPFQAGGKEDPRATARRVLAVIYTTITPNTVVLGVNTNDQNLLLHQLVRGSVSRMTKNLGART